MGKRCSLFLGFQQCDAQEFFSTLLDNLHEVISVCFMEALPFCHFTSFMYCILQICIIAVLQMASVVCILRFTQIWFVKVVFCKGTM